MTAPQHLRRIIDELAKDNDALRSENHRLRLRLEEAVFVDERRQQKLNLVCYGEHVSLRATQQIMVVAWGKKNTQSRGAIANERARRAAAARRIIDDACIQVKDDIRCVVGDDVYFHQQAIKVVAEPDNGAILNLGRWTGSGGADWALWLEDDLRNRRFAWRSRGGHLFQAARTFTLLGETLPVRRPPPLR